VSWSIKPPPIFLLLELSWRGDRPGFADRTLELVVTFLVVISHKDCEILANASLSVFEAVD
jgi:hypothetical protein